MCSGGIFGMDSTVQNYKKRKYLFILQLSIIWFMHDLKIGNNFKGGFLIYVAEYY